MVLPWLGGLSDREAVDRYAFDVRWRYAAGVGGCGGGGWAAFAQTVLVDMCARLRRSGRPDRIFEVGLQAAHAAGLVGRRRVLDSTPLYDAVASQGAQPKIRRDETRRDSGACGVAARHGAGHTTMIMPVAGNANAAGHGLKPTSGSQSGTWV